MTITHSLLDQDTTSIKLAFSNVVTLDDGDKTTVHIVRYMRQRTQPRLVLFPDATLLQTWCNANQVEGAIVGGFFLRDQRLPLGEIWHGSHKISTVPFSAPWSTLRGSIYMSTTGNVQIDYRHILPDRPNGDLLQAGPLLVKDNISRVADGKDYEGFSAGAEQFDSDITAERHPRAAIGLSDSFIWSVVCDGRSQVDAGLTLQEFAEVLVNLGCQTALNLDGGGSASLVTNGKLLNHPRGDGQEYPEGRGIFNAIVFTEI